MMKHFIGGVKASSLERKMTEEDVADLKETFKMFDKDGGGTISADELQSVMKRLGTDVSKGDVTKLIKLVDVNTDGEIDFDEFLTMMKKMPDNEKELQDAFKVFDADGSGSTSKSELNKIMTKFGQTLSAAELDAVFNLVDTDGSGDITFEEFKALMQS